ncbi:MAG: helix-turn-helix transcriptional regulator [Lentisphaerae bacterium]|nr:helix-turn-helix transcriptional regulator [Lentisphaerota bacterium]
MTIEHCTLSQKAATHQRRQHIHKSYHIVLYTRGEGRFILQNAVHCCKPRVLVLTSPGDSHAFGIIDAGQVFYSEITFSFRGKDNNMLDIPFHHLLSLLSGVSTNAINFPHTLTHIQMNEAVGLLEREMDWLEAGGSLSQLRTRSTILQLFEFLLREFYLPKNVDDSRQSSLRTVRAHIEQHYAEHLTIPALARMASLSVGYFQRVYQRAYGLSPIAHQQRLRVEAAQTLLRTTSLRGKEIAARVGFHDEYYFSRIFHKLVGQTPTQYRNK